MEPRIRMELKKQMELGRGGQTQKALGTMMELVRAIETDLWKMMEMLLRLEMLLWLVMRMVS